MHFSDIHELLGIIILEYPSMDVTSAACEAEV